MSTDSDLHTELQAALAGRYLLERELGRGGMGSVYLARDLALDRLVAIKILPPELAVRPELRERFLRETRTAASFSHPNIVPVHAVEESAQLLYFVMGYVEGETLAQRVRRQGPLPVPDAVRLLQEVAWALSYAHGRGVVHRDVKPDNILLERATGRALVTDFGIARSLSASSLTQVGETVGTPHFMSPEQAAGDKLDGRSDLYSLGAVAYFAVTGRLPFDGESAQAIMAMHLSKPAVPVASLRPDLPGPLAAVIDRCLAKSPDQRFATGETLVEALEAVRAQRVEVPPAIRLWTVRADQFFRNGLIFALLSPQIVARFKGDVDQLVFTAMFTVAVLALWSQIPLGMRELARQGYDFAEIRAAVAALDAERNAASEAIQVAPEFRRRRRTLWLVLGTTILFSIVAAGLAMNSRIQLKPGYMGMRTPWVVVLFIAVCLGMGAFVFAMATLASQGRMEQRLHRLWTGRVGRLLYRVASRGIAAGELPGHTIPGTPSPYLSARTVFDQLPGQLRKPLAGVRVELERLEAEIERLTRREQELDGALAEARMGNPTLSGSGIEVRQHALVGELEEARRATVTRRLGVLEAMESLRLALVRVKSGLGRPEDVETEMAGARRLIGQGT